MGLAVVSGFISVVLALSVMLGPPAFAQSKCTPTPADQSASYPGKKNIISSNRLARPAGKALLASGQLLHLELMVLDIACRPVSDARVELWQANPSGQYKKANRAERVTPDPVFAGNGVAYSNSYGVVAFETLYPGGYGNKNARRAPHIHIRVTHHDHPVLTTTFYFEGDVRNEEDVRLKRLGDTTKNRLKIRVMPRAAGDFNAGIKGDAQIVLPGKSLWKRY